jgi:hypothetical protein
MTMTNSEMAKVQEKTLARLVKKILWRKPIKDWQRNDRIELSVWQLRDALESAYLAGKNS